MSIFIDKHELAERKDIINLLKPDIGKKATVTVGHGTWHSTSMTGSFTWPSDSDDLMILNETFANVDGTNKRIYLIYDYKQNKILGWIQQDFAQIVG